MYFCVIYGSPVKAIKNRIRILIKLKGKGDCSGDIWRSLYDLCKTLETAERGPLRGSLGERPNGYLHSGIVRINHVHSISTF